MMRALMLIVILGMNGAFAESPIKDKESSVSKTNQPSAAEVIHVATALDHLTVLEFGEPVTMAAAGSQLFQIERHEDKVLIKPLKNGASTDLFVWTATRRFTFELESSGEVSHMNFAIDNQPPAPKPVVDESARLDEIADMALTRAFLGAERIDSSLVKDVKDGITIRVEHVYRSRSSTYVHYAVVNRNRTPYRIPDPAVALAVPAESAVSVRGLRGVQLNRSLAEKLGPVRAEVLDLAHAEIEKADIGPGEESQGVVAVRRRLDSPAVLRLSFGNDAGLIEIWVVL
jgi:hypothetical protein